MWKHHADPDMSKGHYSEQQVIYSCWDYESNIRNNLEFTNLRDN